MLGKAEARVTRPQLSASAQRGSLGGCGAERLDDSSSASSSWVTAAQLVVRLEDWMPVMLTVLASVSPVFPAPTQLTVADPAEAIVAATVIDRVPSF
jgi:hypothetical protein